MWLDVAFAPTELPLALTAMPGALCAVIDVIRATTTLTIIGERGGHAVQIAPDVPTARAIAANRPEWLLAGELGGATPAGFDFGNSPVALQHAVLTNRDLIFATTNGTKAIHASHAYGAGAICAASLRNAEAVAQYIVRQSAESHTILVCAGRGERVALDDVFTAGVIVAHVQRLAAHHATPLQLTEAARLAAHISQTAGAPLAVLRRSDAGQAIISIGLAADLSLCAEVDVSRIIPHVLPPSMEDAAIMLGFRNIVS